MSDRLPDLDFLKVERDGDILQLPLDRADKRETLSAAFVEEFVALFDWVRRIGAGAVVVRASGPTFCAGLDLVEHQAAGKPSQSNFAITSRIHHISNMPAADAFFAEAFIAGIPNTQPASRDRLASFMNETAAKTLHRSAA